MADTAPKAGHDAERGDNGVAEAGPSRQGRRKVVESLNSELLNLGELKSLNAELLNLGELKKFAYYRDIICEFLATFAFIFIAFSTLCFNTSPVQNVATAVTNLGVAITFGGMVYVLVYLTGAISGGHLNPAITVGMLLVGRLSFHRAFFYLVAQVLGAIAGAAVVRGISTEQFLLAEGASNYIRFGFSDSTAFAAEVIATSLLVIVYLAATDSKQSDIAHHIAPLAPLTIGWVVFMAHMALLPIDGCGINPARSTASAVVYHESIAIAPLWLFWIAPLVGSVVSAVFYQGLLRVDKLDTFQRRVVAA